MIPQQNGEDFLEEQISEEVDMDAERESMFDDYDPDSDESTFEFEEGEE